MKSFIRFFFTILFAVIFLFPAYASAAITPAQRLSGRILLQVESKGEAWYIYPKDLKRYYLGKSDDAYNIMRYLGLGITNADLQKIPKNTDTWSGDSALINRLKGYILLQVQSKGEAWYINPANGKRYYLKDGIAAQDIMRTLGLGATTKDIFSIDPSMKINAIFAKGAGQSEPNEYIEIFNRGALTQELTSWTISDKANHQYSFPSGYTIKSGQSVRVYTNSGTLSFGSEQAIWNNDHDTAYLRGLNGTLVDTYSY